ncbi:hypothetical protein JL721_7815 [Aureococcus anophagefferens]|nr:hypothetical protein JL721_7815 [Aureococcus anophagefferens]
MRALVVAASLWLAAATSPSCPCEDCSDPRLSNASSWALYRLSDVYAHTLSTYDACFWPTSIACDYSRRRAKLSDLGAFLGARGLRKPCDRNAKYVLQKSYFEAVVAALPRDAAKITLVYALGHEACRGAADPRHVDNSRRYVAAARTFLESSKFAVAERADLEPDDDMIYMCNARRFVLSGGGYTRLAGECARNYGAAPAAVYGLGPPATDLVKLPKAARRERDALLAAEKDRHRAKQARQSANGGRRRALH